MSVNLQCDLTHTVDAYAVLPALLVDQQVMRWLAHAHHTPATGGLGTCRNLKSFFEGGWGGVWP